MKYPNREPPTAEEKRRRLRKVIEKDADKLIKEVHIWRLQLLKDFREAHAVILRSIETIKTIEDPSDRLESLYETRKTIGDLYEKTVEQIEYWESLL